MLIPTGGAGGQSESRIMTLSALGRDGSNLFNRMHFFFFFYKENSYLPENRRRRLIPLHLFGDLDTVAAPYA